MIYNHSPSLCNFVENTEFLRNFWLIFVLSVGLLPLMVQAQVDSTQRAPFNSDSLASDTDLSGLADSLLIGVDSLLKDSSVVELSPEQRLIDSLEASADLKEEVVYNASDSIIYDIEKDMLYLYGTASIQYQDINLQADRIRIDWKRETIHGEGYEDANGTYTGAPVFTQGGEDYKARRMSYNFRSQKARIIAARTQQQASSETLTIISDTTKRLKDGTMYAKDVIFTPCECEEDELPSFYFKAKKVKMLPGNKLVTGPVNPVIAGFPLPIVLPFGYLPKFKDGQRSGLVFPQYGEAQDRGFFLRNLGYYFGLGEHIDLLIDGDIYTRGGWRLGATSRYNWRNRFRGNMSFSYGVVRFGESLDPDFSRTTEWRLAWSHNQPLNPNTQISANVNISSSRFLRTVSLDPEDFFQNNLASSVNITKNFQNLPVRLNVTASHRQDLNQNTLSMDLPTMNLTVNRLTPFKSLRNNRALSWLGNLGITYNSQFRNSLTSIPDSIFPDILFSPRDTFQTIVGGDTTLVPGSSFFRNGVQHRSTASTTIKLLNYINIAPSFNFREFWYFETVQKEYNAETGEIIENQIPGFSSTREYSASVSANTNFYGIYQFIGQRELAIRQRFSPTISYNIRPDFADPRFGNFEFVQSDATGNSLRYSIYEDGIFGSPTPGESQAISFGLNSVLEMKYRSKESFEEEFPENEDKFTRVTLLDNLSISSSYNFAQDSFQLSPFRLNARSQLFGQVNVNAGASLDPYILIQDPENEDNTTGIRISQLEIKENGRLGRLTNAQISMSARLPFRKTNQRGSNPNNNRSSAQPNAQSSSQNRNGSPEEPPKEKARTNQGYVEFNMPWTLSMNYNFSYSKPNLTDARIVQTLRLSGTLRLTPKWNMRVTSGYDLENFEITQTSINVTRDLGCWTMSFNWSPFGNLQSYFFSINLKSSALNAVRFTKRSNFQDSRLNLGSFTTF